MVEWVLDIGPESIKNFSIRRPEKNCNVKDQETILLVLDDRLVMKID
jgi:hypothetical protein